MDFCSGGTSDYITDQTLSTIRRAYFFRLMNISRSSDENLVQIEVDEEKISPLSMEKLLSLHEEILQLLTCLI